MDHLSAPDSVETELGIICYRSADVGGFTAVLKGRYSDFLVHEGKRPKEP